MLLTGVEPAQIEARMTQILQSEGLPVDRSRTIAVLCGHSRDRIAGLIIHIEFAFSELLDGTPAEEDMTIAELLNIMERTV